MLLILLYPRLLILNNFYKILDLCYRKSINTRQKRNWWILFDLGFMVELMYERLM